MGPAPAVMGRDSPRISRAREVRRVLSQGRRLNGRRVTAYVLGSDGQTRVAFACSRSVGGAVVRNRARRLMRESWRVLRRRDTGGHLIMFVARPGILGAGLQDVVEDLERTLGPAGVIA
jgi:ribonuclease P protein component